jgi:hypothetical protein
MKQRLIVIMFFIVSISYSQTDTASYFNKTLSKNNFTIELGGKALAYSIGFERTLYTTKKIIIAVNINTSYEPFLYDAILPIGGVVLIGKNQNKLLFGLTATTVFDFTPFPKTRKERFTNRAIGSYYKPLYNLEFIQPSIGWRRYFKKGNSLSISFTPFIPLFLDEEGRFDYLLKIIPTVGLGYNFKL